MSKQRRARRPDSPRLTLVHGGAETAEAAEDAEAAEVAEDAEVAHLRELLSAVGAPADVLRALDESGDPAAIVQQLVDAGFLPTQQDTFDELINGFQPLLKKRATALDAELAGAEFLSMLRGGALEPEDVPKLLAELGAQAELGGRPEALAMMRILTAMGPGKVRTAAAAAGDRMAARGVPEPSWAPGLGAPQVGECFGYADAFGAQESIALTFSYGRRRHAVIVLIDHDLGGGVKDCWVTDRVDGLRTEYRRAAAMGDSQFHDYEPGTARAIVDRALRRPPCPATADQVEDVDTYLDLLRQRVALLPAGAAPALVPARPATAPVGRTVHRLKVSLRGAKPPIWRRLEVPSGVTLRDLHNAVQTAFGWQNSHLWVFETAAGDYGLPDPVLGHGNAATRTLHDVAPGAGDRFRYTYDFGDDWDHDIVVEDVLDAAPGVGYPRCVTGRRAGPPEDCGGIHGYRDLLAVLGDPGHEEHRALLDWLGVDGPGDFDPAAFDLDAINKALSTMARVVVRT